MKKLFSLFAIAVIPVLAQIPAQYQSIYSLVNTQISTFDATLLQGWDGTKYPYASAPQLETASSDLFTSLLGEYQYSTQIEPQLSDIQAEGAKAVTIHIDFPILNQAFYSSNPSQYQQFVTFYQQLMQDVHARGMKVIVETEAATVFPGANTSSFATYYQSLSWTQYMEGRAATALNIVQLIKPDYLTVITEPDSEATNSGQANAGTVTGSTELLQTIMTALQGKTNGVEVGAGAGTWITDYTDYVANFLAQPIDFLDMHIYPVNNNFLPLAATGAQMAHAAGKKVGMSECWDWKILNNELNVLSLVDIEGRNPFGFWAPLDQLFLKTMNDFGQIEQLEFISPFWTHYFEAYISYTTYGSLSPGAVLDQSYTAAGTATSAGKFTSTGHYYQQLLISSPDTTPPATPVAPTVSAGYTTANLSWPLDTDNVGVAGYLVFRNGKLLQQINGLVLYDSGLSENTEYVYTMEAFDAAGNISAMSPETTIKTY
jgi:hypothetical protein